MSSFIMLLLLSATTVAAQNDCPNAATECPDSCTGEQCARYLNAECQKNLCHGLCTPNFFWRGRNVTDRCQIERCSDIVCPGQRECVEVIRPASCPEARSSCRQYIQARCVLPSPPSSCDQISCGEGMYCREKRGGKGVKCARARNCNQLTCSEGSICSEEEGGPVCVTSVALSCEDLNCPEGTVCVSQSIPSRNLTVAQCLDREEAERLPTFETFFCGSGAVICDGEPRDEVCVDIFDSGVYLVPGCTEINCDTASPDSTCRLSNQVCAATPEYLNAVPFTSACVGSTSVLNNSSRCASAPDGRCPSNLVCREVFFEGQFFFSTCGVPAPTFTAPSCAELECPAPLECNELGVVEGRGGVARCAGPNFTGDTEESIRSLLDKIDE